LAHAALSAQWKGFLVNLLMGLLYLSVGMLLFSRPGLGAMSLTWLIASFLIVSGIFRVVFSALTRIENWGWFLLSGLVSVLLGGLIWAQWPVSSLLIIGIYVGIEMLMAGTTLLALVIATRNHDQFRVV
jgi:uncharacterized membrane protein HdeD (DUF308 family)